MTDRFFGRLAEELVARAARATVSQASPANAALLQHLQSTLEVSAGESGSFLAPPLFEATFPWESSGTRLEEVPNLEPELLKAMDAPPAALASYRFERTQAPYRHQLAAWTALALEPPRSVVVRTGTASGKTECFLVPILNDLVREMRQKETGGPLVGVRALFLYPLNALINSQRDRLAAWTDRFAGRIRYCLYNGATPEIAKQHDQNASPHEILSRKLLRSDPSPILVTNATMLEYMLVRAKDAPIRAQSAGKLRWIVLDEAHTYIGSAAAELALLLRRVMHAFGVAPKNVRFIATSATIGGSDADALLQQFLADVAGIDASQVTVIGGNRVVPPLAVALEARHELLPTAAELALLSPAQHFDRLAAVEAVRALRHGLCDLRKAPLPLPEIARALSTGNPTCTNAETLAILDAASSARDKSGADLLPLRGHFFIRTSPGLWACVNPGCAGRIGTKLDDPTWAFGKLSLAHREHCDVCNALVFELVLCTTCGAPSLGAVDNGGSLVPRPWDAADDRNDLDAAEGGDNDDEDPGAPRPNHDELISCGRSEITLDPQTIDPTTGALGACVGGIVVHLARRHDDTHRVRCPRCGGQDSEDRDRFRPVRLGGPFYLSVGIPALLEQLRPEHVGKPSDGRRLLTFSDSRQGSARFAARLQLESERNFVRAFVYHALWDSVRRPDAAIVTKLEAELAQLEPLANLPAIAGVLAEKQSQLDEQRALATQPTAEITWVEMARRLASAPELGWIASSQKFRYAPAALAPAELANMLLFRELVRRPRRQNSLETMGLAALSYPTLARIATAPAEWRQRGRSIEHWRAFLKIAVDFFVRAMTALHVPDNLKRWLGVSISFTRIVPPDDQWQRNKTYPWSRLGPVGRPSRLARYLLNVLHLDDSDLAERSDVNVLLRTAFSQLCQAGFFLQDAAGYRLDLSTQSTLRLVSEAWYCPITRRLLDTTLDRVTPYLLDPLLPDSPRCERVEMPHLLAPFRRRDGASLTVMDAQHLLEADERTAAARRMGVWTEFSDRIAVYAPTLYVETGEHSAQQSKRTLQQLEKRFKDGDVNVLSCSTTMEMGVDIGGLSAVAMNNAPPGPANYLQRSGRAGRFGVPQSAVLTMCQSLPHPEAVFQNPRWAFETPVHVPTVSLGSERIVRRHIGSLLLSHFFESRHLAALDLECKPFFARAGDELSQADHFCGWLRTNALDDERVVDGLRIVTAHTAIGVSDDPATAEPVLARLADDMVEVAEKWRLEHEALREGIRASGGDPDSPETRDPLVRALLRQLKRLEEEYLLRTLADSGFLPSYGFPIGIVPFVHTTAELLQFEKEQPREDGYGQRRGYPSRPISQAIREYAPGATVILNGMAYESAGVTLNWKLPAGDGDQHETQAFRMAWKCKACGAAGTAREKPDSCPQCRGGELRSTLYLEPAGFAVDIRARPTNDLSQQVFIPREPPYVAANTPWRSLPNAATGYVRHDPEGVVIFLSKGAGRHGYVLCLRCGRATEWDGIKPAADVLNDHRRLRGGRGDDEAPVCPGNDQPWALKAGIALGGAARTDVVELLLHDPATGEPLSDPIVATSLAAALREAVARFLGIDTREIAWAISRGRSPTGAAGLSIYLYDSASAGAGFVANVPHDLPELLRQARTILSCAKNNCDRYCHGCLLSFDTQDHAEKLDRKRALAFLSDAFLDAVELPSALRLFGPSTRAELGDVTSSVLAELTRCGGAELRVYTAGAAADWDLARWPLDRTIVRLAASGTRVLLVVPEDVIADMEWDEAAALRARTEAAGVRLAVAPRGGARCGVGWLLVEVGGAARSVGWAVTDIDTMVPGETWGDTRATPARGLLCVRVVAREPLGPCALREPRQDELDKPRPGLYQEVIIRGELDGDHAQSGRKFWELLGEKVPGLAERLAGPVQIAELTYEDRYVTSPLNAATVHRVISHLGEKTGGVGPATKIMLRTTATTSDRLPRGLKDDWSDDACQKAVLCELFADLGTTTVELVARHAAAHARQMVLVWVDGKRLTIRLDQGLTFLKPQSFVSWRFAETPERQASMLRTLAILAKQEARSVVPLYVNGPA